MRMARRPIISALVIIVYRDLIYKILQLFLNMLFRVGLILMHKNYLFSPLPKSSE